MHIDLIYTYLMGITLIIAFSIMIISLVCKNFRIATIDAMTIDYRVFVWASITSCILFIFGLLRSIEIIYTFIFMETCLISLVIFYYIHHRKPPYIKGGWLYTWYDSNYKYLGKTWAKCIYELLQLNGFINSKSEEPFIFVSPSANKGKYERHILDLISEQRHNNIFIVSDIEKIDQHESCWISSDIDSRFIYSENKDALNILENCRDHAIESVDAIFDHKGYIWYAMRDGNSKLLEVFENYYKLLKSGAVLIIDNTPQQHNVFYNMIFHLFGQVYGFCEPSTYAKLTHHMIGSLQEFMESHFDTIPLVHADDQRASIMIYKKK